MIAIIDSGSTKSDWIFIEGKNKITAASEGMNPNFNDVGSLQNIIVKATNGILGGNNIRNIFFFGAGCSGEEQKKKISDAFKNVFSNAEISVDHDIKGAVLATCGDEAGISCIIGTGSNSVYYDGKKIHSNNYGLGYILADEGAGTYLGKKLVTEFLYGLLPKKLSNEFSLKYNLSREDVIQNVYNKPLANAWLASFAQFFAEHKSDRWVRSTIKNGFEKFIQLFVMNYPGYKDIPVHFVGSISFLYKDILKEVIEEKKIILGKVIQKPIDELAEYFKNISE